MAKYTLRDLLQRIQEHGGPQGLDLEHADLAGLDAGPAAVGAELEHARAGQPEAEPAWLAASGGLNLLGAGLEAADLRGADLTAAQLARADLEGADLRGATLEGANLSGADLEGANLAQARLARATLSQANMEGADLQQADLAEACLDGACLEGADLRGASLAGADLQGANLEHADLRQATLQGAVLEKAELEGANLRGADLNGASLCSANLEEADLRGTALQGTDLTGARLHGARFDDERGRRPRAYRGEGATHWAQEIAAQVRAGMAGLGEELAGLGRELAGLEWAADGPAEGTPFSLNIPLEGATAISLSIGLGTVYLVSEARDDILLRCSQEPREQLEIVRTEGAVRIRQKDDWEHERLRGEHVRRVNLQLTLPQALTRLEAKTGLGSIQGQHIAAHVHLCTGKGEIRFQESQLEGEVRTGAGAVVLSALCGDSRVHTGSGDVTVQRLERARLTVATGRGRVTLLNGEVEHLHAQTGLGDLRCACALGAGEHGLETGAGVITVELLAGQAARVEASTGMGQVLSDWPLVRVGRPGPAAMGSMRMVGAIGGEGGKAILSLKTGIGNIYLKRAGAAAQAAGPSAQPGPGTTGATPQASPTAEAAPADATAADVRLAILESLSRGEISVGEAEELLKGLIA